MPTAPPPALMDTVGYGLLKWIPLLLALAGYNLLFAARLQGLVGERAAYHRRRKAVAVSLLIGAGVWLAALLALPVLQH